MIPKKHVLALIGDGYRFSDKILRKHAPVHSRDGVSSASGSASANPSRAALRSLGRSDAPSRRKDAEVVACRGALFPEYDGLESHWGGAQPHHHRRGGGGAVPSAARYQSR